jgi:hypothetical protein
MEITPQLLDEIAQDLSAGHCCFLNIHTSELVSYPNSLNYDDSNLEFWRDVLDLIRKNQKDYIGIEPMESWESFRVMEDFIFQIVPNEHQNRFREAISKKHPFRRFSDLLFEYGSLRNQWFEYKHQRYMTLVSEQLEVALGRTDEE